MVTTRSSHEPRQSGRPRAALCALVAASLLGACGGVEEDVVGEEVARRSQQVTYLTSQYLLGESLPSLLRPLDSDQCLGVENASLRDGAPIVLMNCNSNMTSQKWVVEVYFVPSPGVPPAVYNNQIVFRNVYSNKCIDAGNARPQQHSCHRGPVQQWRSWYMSSYGTYYRNIANGRDLAVGAQITHQLYPAAGSLDAYEAVYADNGECIDVPHSSTANVLLQTYPCHGNSNQRLRIRQSSAPSANYPTYTLKLLNSWKCIEASPYVSGGSRATYQNTCDDTNDYQTWRLVFDLHYGRYHFFNGALVGLEGSLFDNGTWLRTGTPPHGAGPWILRKL